MSRAVPVCLALVLFGAAGSRADETLEDTAWPVNPDVRVDIEILSGRIEIEGWDRDEVRVETDAGGALDIDVSPERVSIRAPHMRGWQRWRGGTDVELSIHLPRGSHVEARTINGPIRVEKVSGTLSLHAAQGEIRVRGEPSEAWLETMNASISFEGSQSRVDARAVNGRIELSGVAERVVASTMNGSITVEGDSLERLDVRTLSGSIEVAVALVPGARADLQTYSGSVEIRLPSDTSARFDVQSFSGKIVNDFASARHSSRSRGFGERVRFDVGKGEGRVHIQTFSGEVRIETEDPP